MPDKEVPDIYVLDKQKILESLSELREVVFGYYRIIYGTKENLVETLTVYHSARLLALTG